MILQNANILIALIFLSTFGDLTPRANVTNATSDFAASETDKASDDDLTAKAMNASAEDLGMAYLVNQSLIKMTEMASAGIQIHTADGIIDDRTAAQKRKEFERRLQIYRDAMMLRGFEDFTGKYSVASVKSACAKSGSLWLSGSAEKAFKDYEIVQDGFSVKLTLKINPEAGAPSANGAFALEGVAVESTLVIEDPINSDYYIKGFLKDGRLEIRPRLEVLNGWPEWASPPKKRDLERCILVLQRDEGQ